METNVTFRRAMNAAKTVGRFVAQENMLIMGRDREGIPSFADHAKQVMQQILHSAYPNAEAGKPDKSEDEMKRLSLASVIRNFFGLFVSKKNSVYIPDEAKKVKKQQRAEDYKAGLDRFYEAQVSGIQDFDLRGDTLKFDLITDQGKIEFNIYENLFEPLDPEIKTNSDKLIRKLRYGIQIVPENSFKLKNFNFQSAKSNALDASLKAFSYLQEHIEDYRAQIGTSFDVFKANIDILLAGMQNLKASVKS